MVGFECRVYPGVDAAVRLVYIGAMEKRVPIGLKLPPRLLAAVDAERAKFKYPPQRTEIIEQLLEEWVVRCRAEREQNGVIHDLRQL